MKLKLLLYPLFCFTVGTASADLIGYWDFENDFNDRSGNSNDGSPVGMTSIDTTTPAAAGEGSLNLVNSDDSYLDINPGSGMQVEENTNFSISIWFRSSTLQRDKRIFSEGSTTNGSVLYNIGTGAPGSGTNQIDFFRRTPATTTNNHELTTSEPFGDNNWHNVVLVDRNGEVNIYVDGSLDLTTTYPKTLLSTNTTTFGGIKRTGPCCGFSGSLDDIGIWDTALNFLQIEAITRGVKPTLIDEDIDTDNDGLPDYWELVYGLDPTDDGSININNGPNGNTDGDNLTQLQEYQILSNPNDEDSDDDTVNDDIESGDGSDPNLVDSDADGLNDGAEKAIGSSPVLGDTDADGLGDAFEVSNGLDPNDAGIIDVNNGPDGDPDSDSLSNLEEQHRGTNPQDNDSDDDGLEDGDEVNTFKTDPANNDSDGDTILDGEETVPGTDGYITDPLRADTDRDSITDSNEILNGSDPTDQNSPNSLEPINKEGLIHVWSFDETEGTTAVDSVGGVHGSWIGDSSNLNWIAQGFLGGAADLAGRNGDGNHFTLEMLGIENEKEMTISVWFQNDGNTDTGYNALFMSRPENWGIALENVDQQADFRFDNAGAGSQGFDSAAVLTRDGTVWHHAAMSVNTITGEIIYSLDGETTTTTKIGGAASISGVGWAIGNDGSTGTNRDFDGRLDDLAVWSNALTAEDLTNIYRNGLRGNAIVTIQPAPLAIFDIEIDGDGSGSLTWNSIPGKTYRISATTDISLPFEDWPIVFGDQLSAAGETTSIVLPKGFVSSSGPKVFFAVRELE